MRTQDNIIAQQQFGDAINNGHLEAPQDLVAPTFVDHNPAPDQAPGADASIHFFTMLTTAFPDALVAVEQMVASGLSACSRTGRALRPPNAGSDVNRYAAASASPTTPRCRRIR